MKQYTEPKKAINTLRPGLCWDDPLDTIDWAFSKESF